MSNPRRRDPANDPLLCGHYRGANGDYHRNRAGDLCAQNVITGTTTCRNHSGKSVARAKAQGQVVMELRRWGLGDSDVDPGELLLRLVSQSAARIAAYAAEMERIVAEAGSLEKAIVGEVWVTDDQGVARKSGEYHRAMSRKEDEERDRGAKFAALAVSAGLAERQVRLAERYGGMVAAMIAEYARALGRNPDEPSERALIVQVIARHAGMSPAQIEGVAA